MTRRGSMLTAVGVLFLFCGSGPAYAVTCQVNGEGVSFGAYDPLARLPQDGVGNISVTCDGATSFSIGLDNGTGGRSAGERRMTGPAVSLGYNLYTDSTRLIVWGDGSGATGTVSGSGSGGNFAVYGRIPAGQNVSAGTYGDLISVTISY